MTMENEKTILILDYDGTLHDSLAVYGAAFRRGMKTLEGKGYISPRLYNDEEIRHWIGYSVKDMWDAFQPDFTEEQKKFGGDLIGRYMEELLDAGQARLYPRALEILSALKERYSLHFLSNCKVSYMEKHKALFGLDRYFDAFYCTEAFGFISKEAILEKIRIPGRTYIVVGDREADKRLAVAHGLPFVGCLYGYGTLEELSGADALIGGIEELPAALGKLEMDG